MKKRGETVTPAAEDIKPIHMPSNSGVPIIMSGFFGLAGFALVFSWFWIAAIGGIGILACLIYRSFDYDEGYYISVDEIKKSEHVA